MLLTKKKRFGQEVFPFTALVGQEKLKLALILNAINPTIAGVLIRGEKGTAKSTAVRALADLLPEIEVVSDCRFKCDPHDYAKMCVSCQKRHLHGESLPVEKKHVEVITLPLNATEDRIAGTIDLERAIKEGLKRVEPGLLADANRGIIYIDEVNLLEDHIVDMLLDAAVSGINVMEREGISFSHPSSFILIGTMNPEEGDLRPQFIDRFGLCVQIEGIHEPDQRVEIIRRRGLFEENPASFLEAWAPKQRELAQRIIEARQLVKTVQLNPNLRLFISGLCVAHKVKGHRADIFMEKTAKTIAAFEGREEVVIEDIFRSAEMVLPHRARTTRPDLEALQSLLNIRFDQDTMDYLSEEMQEGALNWDMGQQMRMGLDSLSQGLEEMNLIDDSQFSMEQGEGQAMPMGSATQEGGDAAGQGQPFMGMGDGQGQDSKSGLGMRGKKRTMMNEGVVFDTGKPFKLPPLFYDRDRLLRHKSGRRKRTQTDNKSGRYVRATSQRRNDDLAFDATLRASAPHQLERMERRKEVAVAIETEDIREKIREKKSGNLLLFIVDASGSMGIKLMTETKGAMLSLLIDAYQRRDKVAMVAFKGERAEVLLPPTNSIEMAKKLMDNLPVGGKTPLTAGLVSGYELIMKHLKKESKVSPLLILISDGEANVGLNPDERRYEGQGYESMLDELNKVAEVIRGEKRIKSLVIDTEARSFATYRWNNKESLSMARRISMKMGAQYYKLRNFKASGIVDVVKRQI